MMISLKKILFEALQDLYRVTSIPALGGVFLLDYKNKILFSEDKSFNTKDLPRFKPQVYISRRKGEQESE